MHGWEDANNILTIPLVRKLKLSLLDVYAHLLGSVADPTYPLCMEEP